MLVNATLLIQNIQLLCFTVVFGVLAFQQWGDPTRRWLWYTFLANTVGAILALLSAHLPLWVNYGVNDEMIPLSYAILNVTILFFDHRPKKSGWLSFLILLAALPFFLHWSSIPGHVLSDAFGDFTIALECVITVYLLLGHSEKPTRAPRLLMAGFLVFFVGVEFARAWVAFILHGDPSVTTPTLALVSAVTYIVNVSLLPLAFIWMMHARLEWDLVQQSIVDSLTSVLNRRGLEQALERELARCRRYDEELTLAMLDLDHFKALNDKYGHSAGDTVLKKIAQLLATRLRETDIVGRFGGEEFVLLLPHTDLLQSRPILDQLCRALRETSGLLSSADVCVTASCGVTSTGQRYSVTAADLLNEADAAMYQAKKSGRDQVCIFQPTISQPAVSLESPPVA